MKIHLLAGVMALGLAACGPAPADDVADAGNGAPAAKRMPLPDCGQVEAEDLGVDGWRHPDCRLMFSDQSGMAIEARYAPAEDDSTEVKIQVVAPGDATLQVQQDMPDAGNSTYSCAPAFITALIVGRSRRCDTATTGILSIGLSGDRRTWRSAERPGSAGASLSM